MMAFIGGLLIGAIAGAVGMYFVLRNNPDFLVKNVGDLLDKIDLDEKLKEAFEEIKSKLKK
jgi:hypothetical protein